MKHKTVHVLGYEFDSLPAHVKVSGRGSGATLRVACQRAIADLFTQHQLRHKQTGAFKLSVVVIAERKRDWSKVKDEVCQCSHPKSHHNGVLHHLDCQQCQCPRFTWKAFLDEKGNEMKVGAS